MRRPIFHGRPDRLRDHRRATAGSVDRGAWRPRLRADAYVTLALNPDGSIDQAKMRAVSSAMDFSFDFQDLLLKPVR